MESYKIISLKCKANCPISPSNQRYKIKGPPKLWIVLSQACPSDMQPAIPTYLLRSIQKNQSEGFRGLPLNQPPSNQYNRPRHGDLARSLILPQQLSQVQMPQETLSPRNNTPTRNMVKRNHRPSDSNIEQANLMASSYILRRQESAPNFNIGRFKEQSEKKERQVTNNYPSRNDMKRSMVIQGSFDRVQSPPPFLIQRKESKAKKALSFDDFVKIKQLGNGKYGKVSLVYEKSTKFICALKQIQKKLLKEEEITQQLERQVKIQMFLNHPNIIKMYGFFDNATHIFIIMEVGMGGQLFHQLKKALPLPQPRVAVIMKQVCEAVNDIHSLRIIHRDIKPENIVVHQNVLKLCDFGWSVHQDNKMRTTFCGTPLYVCPQILKGNEYDEKIDIWSIGIMMYEMVVGENPFRITKQEQLIKIVRDEVKIPSYLVLTPQTKDFLQRCLQKNPQHRANIKQLINHPFLKRFQQKNQKKHSNDV